MIALLDHPNDWQRREARRILGERRDASVLPILRKAILDNKGRLALESLWALYVSGGFDEAFAGKLLAHVNEDVRAWSVRLLGDDNKVSAVPARAVDRLARRETSPVVRSQLACSCKRLPAADGLPIVRELLRHAEDVGDPHIPLLLWWAIEDKVIAHRDRVFGLLDTPDAWRLPLVKRFLLERLARRYLAEGGKVDLQACTHLLEKAPGAEERDLVLRGMDKALEGRLFLDAPAVLTKEIVRLWREKPDSPVRLRLAVRLGEYGSICSSAQANRGHQGFRGRTDSSRRVARSGRQVRYHAGSARFTCGGEKRWSARRRSVGVAAVRRYAHRRARVGPVSPLVLIAASARRRACWPAGRRQV